MSHRQFAVFVTSLLVDLAALSFNQYPSTESYGHGTALVDARSKIDYRCGLARSLDFWGSSHCGPGNSEPWPRSVPSLRPRPLRVWPSPDTLHRFMNATRPLNPVPWQCKSRHRCPVCTKRAWVPAIRQTGESERSAHRVLQIEGDPTVVQEVIARDSEVEEQLEELPVSSVRDYSGEL